MSRYTCGGPTVTAAKSGMRRWRTCLEGTATGPVHHALQPCTRAETGGQSGHDTGPLLHGMKRSSTPSPDPWKGQHRGQPQISGTHVARVQAQNTGTGHTGTESESQLAIVIQNTNLPCKFK